MTARGSMAVSLWKHKIAFERKVATPGQPLRRPAHGGGVDSRVGDVVVFGAHRPARTTARVSTVPGQLKMASLQRAGRAAPAWMTPHWGTAPGRQKHEIALERGAGGWRMAEE
jgi:hypothetical protein